jgi:hypothetical protein
VSAVYALRGCLNVIANEAKRRSNPLFLARQDGLLRGACHRARIRATRWLAMTTKYAFAISLHVSREFWPAGSALSHRRAQGMPGARCARSRACSVESTRVSHHGHTGKRPTFPAQWFYGLFRTLPGDRAFLSPSSADCSAHLMPASGHQDHTTSPSASGAVRQKRQCVHRILSRVRDDLEPPLCGIGRRGL